MADPRPHLHPLFAGILADWRTAVTPNPPSPKPRASRAMRKLSLSLLTLARVLPGILAPAACMGSGSAPDRSADARWTLTHYLAAVSRLPEEPMRYKTVPYHSPAWERLVEMGWTTATVSKDGVATMTKPETRAEGAK